MNLFGVMDISASALQAERVRAEVVAANMANAETTRTADGGPYRRQHVVFQQAGGDGFATSLLASEGDAPGRLRFRPQAWHPDLDRPLLPAEWRWREF